jgi:hypothetical protein
MNVALEARNDGHSEAPGVSVTSSSCSSVVRAALFATVKAHLLQYCNSTHSCIQSLPYSSRRNIDWSQSSQQQQPVQLQPSQQQQPYLPQSQSSQQQQPVQVQPLQQQQLHRITIEDLQR